MLGAPTGTQRVSPNRRVIPAFTFAARGVNLSSLESRPARRARWEYVFWVDVDAAVDDPACAAALDDLRAHTEMVRVLGSYPRASED